MIIATLYQITNIDNGMKYHGIVYRKNKTVEQRFDEHMSGRGGKYLYKEGVLKYGRDKFLLATLCIGELNYVRDLESQLNKTSLFPNGYNGNTSHAIINDSKSHETITRKKRMNWENGKTSKPVPPNWKGKSRSDTMRSKLAASRTGTHRSDSTKHKISESLKGRKISPEVLEKRRIAKDNSVKSGNKKRWLLISPTGEQHSIIGGIGELTKSLGLSTNKTFRKNINTGEPITVDPRQKSNLSGWVIYKYNLDDTEK